MKRILLLTLITIGFLANISAQNAYWETVNGPYGGEFSLVKAPNGNLYATALSGNWKETYRSSDEGHTWQQLTFLQTFFPNEINKRVFIGETGTVYLTIPSQQATYKTVNDGQSWSPTYGFDLELASGILLKAENNAIWRSTNEGQNWTTVLPFPTGIIYGFNFVNTPFGGLLFECRRTVANGDTLTTLYRSFDEGATWAGQDVDHQLSNFFFASINTIMCLKSDTLYRSADGGVTFQTTGIPAIYGPSFTVLTTGRILMEQYKMLQFSDDAGITWDTLSTWEYGGGGVFYQMPPLNDGTIFKMYRNALVRSADGGLTWQFSGTGMRANSTGRISFLSDSLYFASTLIGVWKTTDAGEHWNLLNQETAIQDYAGHFGVTTSGGVFILQRDQLMWSPNGNVFMDVTPPNGMNFDDSDPNFSLNPQNGHLFISTLQGLERSTDSGQSWQVLQDSILLFGSLGFHPSGRVIGFSAFGQVLLSDNNGTSWTPSPVSEMPLVSAIRVAPDGDIYLLGVDNTGATFLWKSEDAGETWIKLPYQLDQTLWWLPIFEISANGHLFTAVNQDISLSTNEGLTWQNLPNPVASLYLTQSLGRISSLAISPGQHLFAGTQHFDGFRSVHPVSVGATIEGYVRVDGDGDCSTDDSQTPLENRAIVAQGDNTTFYTKTDPTGRYVFFVDTGAYQVALHNLHPIWWAYCDSIQSVHLLEYNIADTANFSATALADCPLMTVNVAAPRLRRCFDNLVYVQYCNQGSQTADSSWVDVFLDPYVSFVGSSQAHLDFGNNVIRFFTGDIASGACGQFQLTVLVDCDSTVLGQTHCISAHGFPDTLCTTTPDWSGANIEAQVSCQDSIVRFELKNTGLASSQVLDYIIIEDDVVMFQGQQQYNPGQQLALPLPATGHTLRIESEQEPGHPFSTRAIAFEEGCGGFETLGFINQFSVNGITPSWHRFCLENTGSFDPNDKQGFPLGFGDEHRIRPGQPIEYMIRFQNTGTDTAFTIVVRDTLSPWLDPAAIVPGASSHAYTWKLDGQGIITFTFANILLPDSTTNLSGSQGFITFWIAQQPAVPLGTQIYNDAAIFFDFNAPVITNKTLHTVGEDLMSSAVDVPKAKPAIIQVSPNPAHDVATFSMGKNPFKHHHLQLFDPLGKPVYDVFVNSFHAVIPRNGLGAGAYGWRVSDAFGRLVDSGILIFQ